MKLSEYRPFHRDDNPTDFSTAVEADNNDNPTNFVSVFQTTLQAADVVAGEYELSVSWFWGVNSDKRAAYWQFKINGAATSTVLREVNGDADDVQPEYVRAFFDVPANTAITVEILCVLENIGGAGHVLTILAGDLDIAIQCKSNA